MAAGLAALTLLNADAAESLKKEALRQYLWVKVGRNWVASLSITPQGFAVVRGGNGELPPVVALRYHHRCTKPNKEVSDVSLS